MPKRPCATPFGAPDMNGTQSGWSNATRSNGQAGRVATAEIVVVGAGMVGPVAAMYLARRFGRVDVLEQRVDPRTSSADAVGARSLTVILSARGWRVLDELGVAEAVKAARRFESCQPDGKLQVIASIREIELRLLISQAHLDLVLRWSQAHLFSVVPWLP
jgi:2-polyprenyl-6-methoxyphenol hydroxylase-like FAD-dependent oxidoreductase